MDHVRLLAAEHGMYFTILRPTAYFKDFTDLPWQRMQVGSGRGLVGGGVRYRGRAGCTGDGAAFCGALWTEVKGRLRCMPVCRPALCTHLPPAVQRAPRSTTQLPSTLPAAQRSCWMLVPGGGRARCNPIDGAELATFIADCVLDPTAQRWSNKEVRIGGPQVRAARLSLGTTRHSRRLLASAVVQQCRAWPPRCS